MRFQLILQFPDELVSFDELIAIETAVTEHLANGEVDGHDFGNGEGNIFVCTDRPRDALREIMPLLRSEQLKALRAAYRKVRDDKYTVLWPATLESFEVK